MTRSEQERLICILFEECLVNAYKESLVDRNQCLRLYGPFLEYLSREAYSFLATRCTLQSSGIPPMTAQTILQEAVTLDVARYLECRWPRVEDAHAVTFIALAVSNIIEVFLSYAEDCEAPAQQVAKASAAVKDAAVLHQPCFL
jgi:hypothetical protein